MLEFHIEPTDHVLKASVSYDQEGHAIVFDCLDPVELSRRMGEQGATSFAVGMLQLAVGVETGIVLGLYGYSPREAWIPDNVVPPDAAPGLVVATGVQLDPGISVGIGDSDAWCEAYDKRTGWLRVSRREPTSHGAPVASVCVTDDVIVRLAGSELSDLYVRVP